MRGRVADDLCPECGDPFDPRPDSPLGVGDSWLAMGVGLLSLLLVLTVYLSFVGLIFGFVALFAWQWPTKRDSVYRHRSGNIVRFQIGAFAAVLGMVLLVVLVLTGSLAGLLGLI